MTEAVKRQIRLFSLYGSVIGVVASVVVFLFMTFATRAEVENKNKDVIEHIGDLKTDIREIRNKVDQLLKK